MAARDGAKYDLYHLSSATPVINDAASPVNDVTYLPVGTVGYYAVAGDQIWSNPVAAAPFSLVGGDGNPLTIDPGHFGGIHYASTLTTPLMFVSTGNGYLASTPDGATWTLSAQVRTEDTSRVVGFTRMIEAGGAGNPRLLVGTDRHGYYNLLDGDLAAAADGRRPDFNIADLYNAAVQGLFWDDAPAPPDPDGRLFAFTYGAGLWSSTDLGLDWSRE